MNAVTLLTFLSTIADTPMNTKEEKRKHAFLVYIGVLMSFGGILWGSIALLNGLFYQAIVPFSYTFITLLNFTYMHYSKDFNKPQAVQLLISLLLPFLFQLSLGGFVASGAMIVWALLAIFASFTYKDNNTIIIWLFVFIALIILSAYLDSMVVPFAHDIPDSVSIIFFSINIIVVSTIIFTLFYYFVGSEKKFRLSLEENLVYLQNAQKNLVESEKMASLGRLVAGVAHEINTPIGVAVTAASHQNRSCKDFLKLYESQQVKQEDFDEFIEMSQHTASIILDNLERAASLIQSFKSISVDQSTDDVRKINVKKYIDNIILSLKNEWKKTSHTVEIICPTEYVVEMKAGSLVQILNNLIENSLVHGFDEKENGHIVIEVQDAGTQMKLRYKDDGKGLSQEEKIKFFEPFYTTKRSEGGSGLGTHIIYNIVTQSLNGEIKILEDKNKGLGLEIQIPIKRIKDV